MQLDKTQLITAVIFGLFLIIMLVMILIPATRGHICDESREAIYAVGKECSKCSEYAHHQCLEARLALRNTVRHYCKRKKDNKPCPDWSYCQKDLTKALSLLDEAVERCQAAALKTSK